MARRETYTTSGALGANGATSVILASESDQVLVNLVGTFTGTVTFEGTVDNTNWFAVAGNATNATASTTLVTTATAAGAFRFNTIGMTRLRMRVSAYTSGSLAVVSSALARGK